MFTNIKIFRDDSNKADGTDKNSLIKRITLKTDSTVEDTSSTNPEQNTKLKDNLNLLCPAEYDTLEFAQSISSTTQTENNDFGDKEALIKAQCEKEAPPILKTAAAKPSSGPKKTAPESTASTAAPPAAPSGPKPTTEPERKAVASRPNPTTSVTPQASGQKPAGRASVTSAASPAVTASQLSRHGVKSGQESKKAGTGKTQGGSLTSNSKHSPKKFNMKELTKKHKKQNRISTIKKQLKTNNKKTLFSRRSKKYQE
jgi:hypothetical protein